MLGELPFLSPSFHHCRQCTPPSCVKGGKDGEKGEVSLLFSNSFLQMQC